MNQLPTLAIPPSLWAPYIDFGKATVILGNAKTGKTAFVGNLAAAVSNGMPLAGIQTVESHVTLTSTHKDVLSVFTSAGGGAGLRVEYKPAPHGITTREVVRMLQERKHVGDRCLFVFDSIECILADWDHPKSATDLADLVADTGHAVVLTADLRKMSIGGIPTALGLGLNLLQFEQANNDWKAICGHRSAIPRRRFRIGDTGVIEFHPDDWNPGAV